MDDQSGPQITVSIDECYEGELDASWLCNIALAGLAAGRVKGSAEASLLITDDETVQALNAEYRGLDETTDVLSFSSDHPGHWEGDGDGPVPDSDGSEFVFPPGIPRPLGEIIVSWPQAQRQAFEHGASPAQELAHLVIHGALHLVGYDHLESEETELMQAREREALEALQLKESPHP